jgi:thiol:disulfide interchange protein
MKKNWVDWLFYGVIGVVFLGLVLWFARPTPEDSIAWHGTLAEATSAAAESGKPVFVKFTASWCGPCQTMDRQTFPDTRVGEALAAFEAVKVDGDEHPDLMQQYEVMYYPTLMVLSPGGEVVKRRDQAMGPSDLLAFLGGD